MAKRKRTNSDLQSITQKTDNEQHEHHQQRRWTQGLWKGKQLLLHMWHRRVSLVTNSVINHETENYRIVEHIHCHNALQITVCPFSFGHCTVFPS
jgi:hypothetical protein